MRNHKTSSTAQAANCENLLFRRAAPPYAARVNVQLVHPADSIQIVSAMEGKLSSFDRAEGYWLTAGQGVLLALEK